MRINRKDLQKLSRIRQREAKILLDSGCWDGARYLIGYAVECALKACIAKTTLRYDFPDKDLVKEVFVHDLQKLRSLAGLKADFDADATTNPDLATNWATVKDWHESLRYDWTCTETVARGMLDACVSKNGGILPWIKKRW